MQRKQVADRLIEEAAALVSCAGWLESLAIGGRPVVNLRPEEGSPETYYVAVDQSCAILRANAQWRVANRPPRCVGVFIGQVILLPTRAKDESVVCLRKKRPQGRK